jgi:hypothetical protein
VLYREEERRFAQADATAPLLDAVYLRAFVPEPDEACEADQANACDEDEEEGRVEGRAARAVAARFQREILRRIHQRPVEMPLGCEELAW